MDEGLFKVGTFGQRASWSYQAKFEIETTDLISDRNTEGQQLRGSIHDDSL